MPSPRDLLTSANVTPRQYCTTCTHAANTVSLDPKCQVCLSDGGARAAGMPALWTCPSCKYLNDENVMNCDYCRAVKPPQWERE